MDKDRVEGAAHRVKGAIKEGVGKVTGDAKTEAEGAALTNTPRATPPSRPFDPEVGPPEPAKARTPLIALFKMFAVAPYQTEIPAANVELTFVIVFEETVEVPGCSN